MRLFQRVSGICLVVALTCPMLAQSSKRLEGLFFGFDVNERIRHLQSPDLELEANFGSLIDVLTDANAFVRGTATRLLFERDNNAADHILARLTQADPITQRALGEALLFGVATSNGGMLKNVEWPEQFLRATSSLRCNTRVCITRWQVPRYPALALQGQISGRVLIQVAVDRTGIKTTSSKGHPILVKAVEEALREWEFETVVAAQEIVVDFDIVGKPSDLGETTAVFRLPDYIHVMSRPARIL